MHFSKMVANLMPVLVMLTSGELGPLLSPDPDGDQDARSLLRMSDLINDRVLWVGLDGETQQLIALQHRLAAQLESLGFPRERRAYHPHLTLARTHSPLDARHLAEPFTEWTSQPMRIDQIALFASTLKPGGAEYRCLYSTTLTG